MKSMPLLACIPFLLPGCLEVDYVRHNMEVTLKDGVPCFSPLSDDKVRKKEVGIYSFHIAQDVPNALPKFPWGKILDKEIFLSGDECIPYDGDTPLEKNTLYSFGFDAHVTGQKPEEEHLYSTVFCLSDKKNGETVIQQFLVNYPKVDGAPEPPTTCPPLPEDAPAANPGEGASTP